MFDSSGCNTQPVHWLVIHDTAQVRQLAAMVVDGLRHAIEQTLHVSIGRSLRCILARMRRQHVPGDWISRVPRQPVPKQRSGFLGAVQLVEQEAQILVGHRRRRLPAQG